MSTAKPFHLRNPGKLLHPVWKARTIAVTGLTGRLVALINAGRDSKNIAVLRDAEAKLTPLHGPSIVRKSRSRGIADEHSGDWRRRTRTRTGLETKSEPARGKNLVRSGEWWYRVGSGARGCRCGRRCCDPRTCRENSP